MQAQDNMVPVAALAAPEATAWMVGMLLMVDFMLLMVFAVSVLMRQRPPSPPSVKDTGELSSCTTASTVAQEHDLSENLRKTPPDLCASVAQYLPLEDVACLSSVNQALCRTFWDADETWVMLACIHNIHLDDAGATCARESFRRVTFRVDCAELMALATPCVRACSGEASMTLFCEAAHVLHGLMPRDGTALAKQLCAIVEPALASYDAGNVHVRDAAEDFLHKVRCRRDLFSPQELELLEDAQIQATLQHDLMELTMQEHYSQLEAQKDAAQHWMSSLDAMTV